MNPIKSTKDYIKDWWVEDVTRHVSWTIIKQKLFSPVYFLTSYRGFVILIIIFIFAVWLGRRSVIAETGIAVNDFEVVNNACNSPDTLRVRYERIVNLLDQTVVRKLVFYCP